MVRRVETPEEVPKKPRAPYPFADSASRRQVRTDPHMSRIFETLFEVDIWEDFKRLKSALRVGEKHRDYATLMKALDDAEDNARLAHSLFVNAKLITERFEADALLIEAGMRKEANGALQAEKAEGKRSKSITDADVVAQCATMYPDEWSRLQVERRQHKLTVSHLEHLVTCWTSRCRSLQTMVSKVR